MVTSVEREGFMGGCTVWTDKDTKVESRVIKLAYKTDD